jgi:hypothetical protein
VTGSAVGPSSAGGSPAGFIGSGLTAMACDGEKHIDLADLRVAGLRGTQGTPPINCLLVGNTLDSLSNSTPEAALEGL